MNSDRINSNLRKTAEIIDTVFTLKFALLKARHPELSDGEARSRIYRGILERKDRQWRSQTQS